MQNDSLIRPIEKWFLGAKKGRKGKLTHMPKPPPIVGATIFCMCCRTVDVITRARFQVNRFTGFGAPGGRKWPSPIDLSHRPYNSVRINVLHCDICGFHDFVETSVPIEIQLITLIHYKNDVNTENCFQNGGLPPSWTWENYSFGQLTCIDMWFFTFPNFASIGQ